MVPPGSKPILMPVGGTTARAVTSVLLLDLPRAEFNANRAAMVDALAMQYGVAATRITLAVADEVRAQRRLQLSQPLQVTVTVAMPATAVGPSSLISSFDRLLAAVSNVSDATLGELLGRALGTAPLSVITMRAAQAETINVGCPVGHW